MSRHGKRKNKRSDAPEDLVSRARQLMARGDLREAQKVAKAAYVKEPTEENHNFYERVCFQRAEQLLARGQRDEGRAILRELSERGLHEETVRRRAPELFARAGMMEQALRLGDGDAAADASRLAAMAADQAVLYPAEANQAPPETRTHAAAVRAALKALEDGKDSDADQAVAGIDRSSPFADWRIFIRGLAAYYRQEIEEARRSWSRLDPQRPPAKVVSALEHWGGSRAAGAAGAAASYSDLSLEELDRSLGQQPVLGPLNQIAQLAAENRWDEAIVVLRTARGALRQFDPEFLRRLVGVFYNRLAFEGDDAALRKLSRAVDGPPLDPWWHRAHALAAENSPDEDLELSDDIWLRYEKDLANLPAFNAQERRLARALVWRRVGDALLHDFGEDQEQALIVGRQGDESPEEVISFFEKCLELAPEHSFSYQALAHACEATGRLERAAETYEQLVERFPEDFDSLLWLANHFMRRDKPPRAIDYLQRARKLRPLDATLKMSLGYQHVSLARHEALAGRFEEGRRHFAEAATIYPPVNDDYTYLTKRSIFEEKAGDMEAAKRWQAQAREQIAEPAPVLLLEAVESRRYQLPASHGKALAEQWIKELKKKCRSETAGAMCQLLHGYLVAELEYTGRASHLAELIKYVERGSRVRWREEDLRHVCQFLDFVHKQKHGNVLATLEKYVKKGVRSFPQSAFFHFFLGELEFGKGPYQCNRRLAHDSFSRAVALSETPTDPAEAIVREAAQKRLTFLGAVGDAPPLPLNFYDDLPFLDDDYDDEYDDFDESDLQALGPQMAELAQNPAMRDLIAGMARSMGIDPDEAFDHIARRTQSDSQETGRSKPAKKPKRKKK
jgi:tetratricopeptide (TPR) repeat protein